MRNYKLLQFNVIRLPAIESGWQALKKASAIAKRRYGGQAGRARVGRAGVGV